MRRTANATPSGRRSLKCKCFVLRRLEEGIFGLLEDQPFVCESEARAGFSSRLRMNKSVKQNAATSMCFERSPH